MKTNTVFRHRLSGDEILALGHVRISASSDALGWNGLRLEVGSNHGWDVDDLMVDGHYVGINLDKNTLQLDTRNESSWRSASMPPLTLWINPEGCPFSLHHSQDSYWASCVIEGRFLDEIAGGHYELETGYGIEDGLLAHLFQALVANLHGRDRRRHSKALDDELIRAFVHALATRHGNSAAELSIKGGIAPKQLKSLLSWLEENIEGSLTVNHMAARVGLSAAHFSREFKRSTGLTPWGYVIQLRLERAYLYIEQGQSVCFAAARCGFSDQPHLSRLFKQRFGLSPSAFIKGKAFDKSVSVITQTAMRP